MRIQFVQDAIDILKRKKKIKFIEDSFDITRTRIKLLQDLIIKKINEDKINLEEAEILFNFGYHAKPKKDFNCTWEDSPNADTKNDIEILQRLKELYKKNGNIFRPSDVSDMWQCLLVPIYQSLFTYLEKNEDEKSLNFLNNMCVNEATYGFLSANEKNKKSKPKKDKYEKIKEQSIKFYHMDVLLSLAEWLNVLPAESTDKESQEDYIYSNPDAIIELIEKKLGFEIRIPEFQNGLSGIKTSRGCFINRHLIYLYIALRIKEFCKDIPNPRICEIGGGVGFLAYYCNLIGLKDITMIDIPSVSLISSYFMMKNMPERKFLLSGDENIYNEPDAIKILFPKYFNEAPDNQFDIVVNCDSFPEINAQVTREYLKNIKRTSKLFYSINHEWHPEELHEKNISNLTDHVGGFNRKFRNLFWLRKGYVEELYKVKKGR